tara:strand:+ start:1212 stop:2657 length:1446 start_codon:yes stop_codon:yes gene_type:complete
MVTLEQEPKYKLIPVGSPIPFTVYHDPTIQNKFKIKYTAKVFVHTKTSASLTNIENRVAVLKVTPNGAGKGIFDLAPILENYVSPDYEGGQTISDDPTFKSQYNSVEYSEFEPHTIHQIDKFCCNQNSVRFFYVKFNVEAADTVTGQVTQQTSDKHAGSYLIYNGVLYDTDILKLDSSGNYGYNLNRSTSQSGFILNSTNSRFLSNAPTTQYVREKDYLTLAFFSQYNSDFIVAPSGANNAVKGIRTRFYYNGSVTVSNIRQLSGSVGGHYGYIGDSNVKLQYVGVGLGNLDASGIPIPANWDYYTVHAEDDASNTISDTYYFYPQVDDCKGFETIRLTWLNKFGVWDYYNFTKKSVRSFNTKRKSYTQITGSWNGNRHMLDGHTGGKKHYNTSVSEKIKLNTDYITEAEAVWLEELFISNEVYILEKSKTDSTVEGYIRKYIKPALITNSTHTRKTKANDRLIQYTFEVETTKTKKTQKI